MRRLRYLALSAPSVLPWLSFIKFHELNVFKAKVKVFTSAVISGPLQIEVRRGYCYNLQDVKKCPNLNLE